MNDLPATERLAYELRKLRTNASSPSLAMIEGWGQRQTPAVNLSKSKLSPWFSGKSVPANGRPFTTLIDLLEARALQKSGTPKRGAAEWEKMRKAADQERRCADSGGSAPSSGDVRSTPDGAEASQRAASPLGTYLMAARREAEQHPYLGIRRGAPPPLTAIYMHQHLRAHIAPPHRANAGPAGGDPCRPEGDRR